MKFERIPCWPTPIFTRNEKKLELWNSELRNLIIDKATVRQDEMLGLSQVGGWRTDTDLLRIKSGGMEALANCIYDSCATMHRALYIGQSPRVIPPLVAEAWGNVYGKGDFQIAHTHHDSLWSGVYYVDVPAESFHGEGALEFYDPRPGAIILGDKPSTNYQIQPVPGLLIIFPSWLRHSVIPHNSPGLRISIAFNVGLDKTEI